MNTTLAPSAGGLASLLLHARASGTFDIRYCCNGLLSGALRSAAPRRAAPPRRAALRSAAQRSAFLLCRARPPSLLLFLSLAAALLRVLSRPLPPNPPPPSKPSP